MPVIAVSERMVPGVAESKLMRWLLLVTANTVVGQQRSSSSSTVRGRDRRGSDVVGPLPCAQPLTQRTSLFQIMEHLDVKW
jgi:hypothetical protein